MNQEFYDDLREARIKYRMNDFDALFDEICPSIDSLVKFIRDKTRYIDMEKNESGNFKGVIGLSGGLDSAVVASLAVKALGKENVYGIMMPSDTNQSIDLEYAEKHAKQLGIKYDIIPINEIEEAFEKIEDYFETDLQKGNVKARIRMCLLYDKAKHVDGLVLGTTNRTEYMTGYYTKYGDGGIDMEPILPLYKTQVRKIAKQLAVPDEIIQRSPTAGLWGNQTDEDELGISYEQLDKIVLGYDLDFKNEKIVEILGIDHNKVDEFFMRKNNNKHKRLPIPHPKMKFSLEEKDTRTSSHFYDERHEWSEIQQELEEVKKRGGKVV